MTATIGRRTFVVGLGSAAVAWPLAGRAQAPGRIYRIGFLIPTPRDRLPVAALFDELRLHGFIENQNYHPKASVYWLPLVVSPMWYCRSLLGRAR